MSKKRFFTKHAKSSAALISIGLHLLIIVIALSYVAVTVIQKDDKTFEATFEFSKTVFFCSIESASISFANSFSYFLSDLRVL